jgi:hypothetical protein
MCGRQARDDEAPTPAIRPGRSAGDRLEGVDQVVDPFVRTDVPDEPVHDVVPGEPVSLPCLGLGHLVWVNTEIGRVRHVEHLRVGDLVGRGSGFDGPRRQDVDQLRAGDHRLAQGPVQGRVRCVVRQHVVDRPDDLSAGHPERVERGDERADALEPLSLVGHATQHTGQPMQVEDDDRALGRPQRHERREGGRVVEVRQPIHPDGHDARLLGVPGEQRLERVLGVVHPHHEEDRPIMAGGPNPRDALARILEVAAFRPYIGARRRATQEAAHRRSKLRHAAKDR